MIVDLTVVRKFMTASSAGVNSGSAPNSDSNMRSRSSWLPATRIYSFIKCTAGQWFMVTIRIWNILSLLLLGLVCSSFKTSGIDGMAFRRSSISALASEPAETIMWALQFKSFHNTAISMIQKWEITFVNNNFQRPSYHWVPGTSSPPFIWWYSVAAQAVKNICTVGRK